MMELIPACIKDEELLKEIDQYINDNHHFHLWWLGQSGYLLLWKGKRVLIDPYLSDSLTEKYAATNKPHVRMSERVIDPSLLKDILIVTSSHNHTDHYDMFTFNTADPASFIHEAEMILQPHHVLPIGGHFSSESLGR